MSKGMMGVKIDRNGLLGPNGIVLVRTGMGKCECMKASENTEKLPVLAYFSNKRACRDQLPTICGGEETLLVEDKPEVPEATDKPETPPAPPVT